MAVSDSSLDSVEPPLRHIAFASHVKLPQAPELSESELSTPPAAASTETSRDEAYGNYLHQIDARIDRAWTRPRESVPEAGFRCQVRIEQDPAGNVTEIALEVCNGSPQWQLSLLHAIQSASPLPAPGDPSVFVRTVRMQFQAGGEKTGETTTPVLSLPLPPSISRKANRANS